MKFDKERQCFVNDDGTFIKPVQNGCRGHGSYGNKYKCSSLACVPLDCDHTPAVNGHRGNRCVNEKDGATCYQLARRLHRWHAYLRKELAI